MTFTKAKKKIIIPVISVIVALLIVFTVVIPKISEYRRQKADYEKFSQQLQQIVKHGSVLYEKRHLSLELAKKWKTLSEELEHFADEKEIIKSFVNRDARSGLKIQSFERNYEQETESGKVIYFKLQVQGYFEDIRDYLEQLENVYPVIMITQLSIKPDERFSGFKPLLIAIIEGNVTVVL